MRVTEESEKAALKLNIQKTEIMASVPIPSWDHLKHESFHFDEVQLSIFSFIPDAFAVISKKLLPDLKS